MLAIETIAMRGQPVAERLRATFDESGGTIGRGNASTLLLPDPNRRISRTQATIAFQAGGFVLTDTGTRNPLAVNGRALGAGVQARLAEGDELTVGPYRLIVHLGDRPQQTPVTSLSATDPRSRAPTRDDPPSTILSNAASSESLADSLPDSAPSPLPQSTEAVSSPESVSRPAALDAIPPDLDASVTASDPVHAGPPAERKHQSSAVAKDSAQIFELRGARVEPCLGDEWIIDRPALTSPSNRPDPLGLYRFVPEDSTSSRVPVLYDVYEPLPWVEEEPVAPTSGPDARPAPSADEQAHVAQTPDAGALTLDLGSEAALASQLATPGTNTGDLSAQLAEAFLRGAGVKDVTLPNGMTPEMMEVVGRILRESVQGTLDLLFARSEVKVDLCSSATVITPRDNNPLKFSPNAEVALSHLLEPKGHGFMTPIRAMRDAYEDLRAHQIGVLAGMRAALFGVMTRFRPEQLETSFKQRSLLGRLLPINRKARQWDLFTELYREISAEAEKDSRVVFGKEFQRAYEAQLAKRSSEKGKANAPFRPTQRAA